MLSSIIESISAASIRIPQCNGLDRYLVTNAPSIRERQATGQRVRAPACREATFAARGALVSKAAEGTGCRVERPCATRGFPPVHDRPLTTCLVAAACSRELSALCAPPSRGAQLPSPHRSRPVWTDASAQARSAGMTPKDPPRRAVLPRPALPRTYLRARISAPGNCRSQRGCM